METVKMKTKSPWLYGLLLILFIGCSENNETDEQTQNFGELLQATWKLTHIWDNGIPRDSQGPCDNPQTITVMETVFRTHLIDDDNCGFETQNFNYTLEGDTITLTLSGNTIKLQILELDEDTLRFKFIYHTQEGGEFDGEIWELEKIS